MLEKYLSEPYFILFLGALACYVVAWLIALGAGHFATRGNPYKSALWCWFFPLLLQTLMIIGFMGYIAREMSAEGRESSEILFYNVGLIVLLIVNCIVLLSIWSRAREIRF